MLFGRAEKFSLVNGSRENVWCGLLDEITASQNTTMYEESIIDFSYSTLKERLEDIYTQKKTEGDWTLTMKSSSQREFRSFKSEKFSPVFH